MIHETVLTDMQSMSVWGEVSREQATEYLSLQIWEEKMYSEEGKMFSKL